MAERRADNREEVASFALVFGQDGRRKSPPISSSCSSINLHAAGSSIPARLSDVGELGLVGEPLEGDGVGAGVEVESLCCSIVLPEIAAFLRGLAG
jgi:hypothetical protein